MAIAVWVKWLAVPMPPPGPCEANAVAAEDTATIVAIATRETFTRDDVMTISPSKITEEDTTIVYAGFAHASENFGNPQHRLRIHLRGVVIHSTFTSLTSICELRRHDAARMSRTGPPPT
jgi:hypothetical protein